MKKFIIALFLTTTTVFAQEVDCPFSPNQYFPQIDINIKESDTEGKVIYTYILGNSSESPGTFGGINILTNEPLNEVNKAQAQWQFIHRNNKFYQGMRDYIKKPTVAPGESFEAFSFEGSSYHGLVPVRFLQNTRDVRKRGRYKLKATEATPCPGIFALGSSAEQDPHARSLAIAPIPKNQKSAISLIKDEGIWTGSVYQNDKLVKISPLDKGTKELLILGSKELNVKDIDIKSLKIGRGEAKVKKTQTIKANAVNNIDTLSKAKADFDNLAITFDLQEANILCELDHALYIEGQTKKGNKFFSGVRIKPVICDLNTFSKELPKIKDAMEAYHSGK